MNYFIIGLIVGIIISILALRLSCSGVLNVIFEKDHKERPSVYLGLSKPIKSIVNRYFVILSVRTKTIDQVIKEIDKENSRTRK